MKIFFTRIGLIVILLLASLPARSGSIEDELAGKIDIIVSKDGTGDFKTVQEAINSVEDFNLETTVIFIRNGEYYEKIIVPYTKTNITLIGEDVDSTILTFDDYTNEIDKTFPVTSFRADADNFTAINITFDNTADGLGWSLVFSSYGDKQTFYHCRFLGWQDTYFLSWRVRNYMKDCFIEGVTDYIYGYGIGVYDSCQIHTVGSGYITAAATSQYYSYGLTFRDCRLTNLSSISGYYLGRPWQGAPHVAYLHCYEPASVSPAGWTAMNPNIYPFFAEYECFGPGFKPDSRSTNEHYPGVQLTEEQAQNYLDLSKVFAASSFPSPEESDLEIEEMIQPFEDANFPYLILGVMIGSRDTFPDIPSDDWLPDVDNNDIIQVVRKNFKPFMDSSYMTVPVLENISVGGTPLDGFNPETFFYAIELNEGDTVPPPVVAELQNGYTRIKYPDEVPGWTQLDIYSKDYTTKATYKLFNSTDSAYWDAGLEFLGFNRTDTIELQEGVYNYDVELDKSISRISSLQYTKSYTGASARRTLPTEIPGTGTVEITSMSETFKNTYTINFSYITGNEAIKNSHLKNDFEILNPVSDIGYLKISEPSDEILNLKVYNITGTNVYSGSLERSSGENLLTVDFSSLGQGIYLYQILSGCQSFSGKLIKLN